MAAQHPYLLQTRCGHCIERYWARRLGTEMSCILSCFDSHLSALKGVSLGLALAIVVAGCTTTGGGNPSRQQLDRGGLPAGGTGAQAQGVGGSLDGPEGAPRSGQDLSRMGAAGLFGSSNGGLNAPGGVPVALLAPISGRLEGPGRALLEGAQMALFDVKNPGLRLLPLDTGGTTLGAEQAAREALRQGARLIIGPLLADNVMAIRPILETAGIPAIAFSNSSRVAGGGVYLAGLTPESQVRAIVAHAAMEGRKRFAMLAPSNEYGTVAVDALRAAVQEFGVGFGPIDFYTPDTMDFSEQIRTLSNYDRRVRALAQQRRLLSQQGGEAARRALRRLQGLDTWGAPPFDALILPVLNAQTLRLLSAQLSFYDVDQPEVQILGLQRWDTFSDLEAEPGLVGSRFPAIRSAYRGGFAQRFAQLFGYAPPALSALAYDITAVAAALAGDALRPPRYDEATLKDRQGFIGAQGLFRFSAEGVAERGYTILEVSGTGLTEVQAAPTNLDTPIFDPRSAPQGPVSSTPPGAQAPGTQTPGGQPPGTQTPGAAGQPTG